MTYSMITAQSKMFWIEDHHHYLLIMIMIMRTKILWIINVGAVINAHLHQLWTVILTLSLGIVSEHHANVTMLHLLVISVIPLHCKDVVSHPMKLVTARASAARALLSPFYHIVKITIRVSNVTTLTRTVQLSVNFPNFPAPTFASLFKTFARA